MVKLVRNSRRHGYVAETWLQWKPETNLVLRDVMSHGADTLLQRCSMRTLPRRYSVRCTLYVATTLQRVRVHNFLATNNRLFYYDVRSATLMSKRIFKKKMGAKTLDTRSSLEELVLRVHFKLAYLPDVPHRSYVHAWSPNLARKRLFRSPLAARIPKLCIVVATYTMHHCASA